MPEAQVQQEPKAFYKSKTVWVNILGAVAALAALFGVDVGPVQMAPAEANEVATGAGVLAGLNLVLRGVTDTAIQWKTAGLIK